MPNKACRETALHILSCIVGADEGSLQYLERTGFRVLQYIKQTQKLLSMHHLKGKKNMLQRQLIIDSISTVKRTHKSLLAPRISML